MAPTESNAEVGPGRAFAFFVGRSSVGPEVSRASKPSSSVALRPAIWVSSLREWPLMGSLPIVRAAPWGAFTILSRLATRSVHANPYNTGKMTRRSAPASAPAGGTACCWEASDGRTTVAPRLFVRTLYGQKRVDMVRGHAMLSNTILSASERHGQPGEVRQTDSHPLPQVHPWRLLDDASGNARERPVGGRGARRSVRGMQSRRRSLPTRGDVQTSPSFHKGAPGQ